MKSKTNLKNIERIINIYYRNAHIIHYYVEDMNEIFQRLCIFGSCYSLDPDDFGQKFFSCCVVGLDVTSISLMDDLDITTNRYEALYKFKCLL